MSELFILLGPHDTSQGYQRDEFWQTKVQTQSGVYLTFWRNGSWYNRGFIDIWQSLAVHVQRRPALEADSIFTMLNRILPLVLWLLRYRVVAQQATCLLTGDSWVGLRTRL